MQTILWNFKIVLSAVSKPAGTLAEAKEGDKTRKYPRGTGIHAMTMTLQDFFCHSNQNTGDIIGWEHDISGSSPELWLMVIHFPVFVLR